MPAYIVSFIDSANHTIRQNTPDVAASTVLKDFGYKGFLVSKLLN